jgi:hypothetical protein
LKRGANRADRSTLNAFGMFISMDVPGKQYVL